MHGGGPKVVAGIALPDAYTKENLTLVEKGVENMVHMIGVIRKSGINPVVCVNRFYTDTDAEIAIVRKAAEAAGARCAESSIGSRVVTVRSSLRMRLSMHARKKTTSSSSIPQK